MESRWYQTPEQTREGWCELYQMLLYHMPKGVRLMDEEQKPFFTGYEYGTLYDWDQYFEGLVQMAIGWPTDYIVNAIRMFLDRQDPDGHIGRSVPDRWHHDMVKPFLAQLALLAWHADGDLAWLRGEPYRRLTRYVDNWLRTKDRRGDGLSVWMSAGHTGMDNQSERAGGGTDGYCEGVDLNAYLVRESRAMSVLAEVLGEAADAARFATAADQRCEAIRRHLWNEDDGFFYDRDARDGSRIPVKHAGAFATLWAGAASEEQAVRMVREHLENEAEFARPWPIPALAASEPGYRAGFAPGDHPRCCSWRAHTWIPTNYYTFQGLMRYGFKAQAGHLVKRTWEMFLTHPFYEYYVTENGLGTGLRPFWGWSSLALFMPLEHRHGMDLTAIARESDALPRLRTTVRAILHGGAIP